MNRVRDVVSDVDHATFTQADVESNDVRCPDSNAAKEMYAGMLTHSPWLFCLAFSYACDSLSHKRIILLDLRTCVSAMQ